MKLHLITSEEPPKNGETLTAVCGAEVPNARTVFWWDDDFEPIWGEFVFSYRPCSKCVSMDLGKRYIAGVLSGQDSSDVERGIQETTV
jgi:hypothetical protein